MNQAERDQLDAKGIQWNTALLDLTSPRGYSNEPAKVLAEFPCICCSKGFFASACDSKRLCAECLCVKLSELASVALYYTKKTCANCSTKFVSNYYDMKLCPTCWNYRDVVIDPPADP